MLINDCSAAQVIVSFIWLKHNFDVNQRNAFWVQCLINKVYYYFYIFDIIIVIVMIIKNNNCYYYCYYYYGSIEVANKAILVIVLASSLSTPRG